jgi:hypothetical protein
VAVEVIIDQRLVINAVVLSDHIKMAALEMQSEAKDSTTMGTSGWKTFLAGLREGTLGVNFLNDYAASSVDATLWPLFSSGTGVTTFATRKSSGSISTTNPEYSGSIVVTQHKTGATVGELATMDVQYPTTGAVARATA